MRGCNDDDDDDDDHIGSDNDDDDDDDAIDDDDDVDDNDDDGYDDDGDNDDDDDNDGYDHDDDEDDDGIDNDRCRPPHQVHTVQERTADERQRHDAGGYGGGRVRHSLPQWGDVRLQQLHLLLHYRPLLPQHQHARHQPGPAVP